MKDKPSVKNVITKFTDWRIRHISNKNFIIILSIVVGALGGVASSLMKQLSLLIEEFVESFSHVEFHNYLYFFFPAIGILLTVLYVQIFLKGKLGRGIGNVIFSVARRNGDLPPDKTYSHIITSALTIGFGGSAGLEAPIVVTGSAIGSNIGKLLNLNSRETILLLACGTAAGIAAIFYSPITGVIFAMEVLLIELTIPAFIPLLIASASAAVVSKMLHSRQLFHLITGGWELKAIPIYVLFGIFCGLLSWYTTKVTLYTEDWIKARKGIYLKAILGGLVLGGMIFLLPPLYGEGYPTVESLLHRQYFNLVNNSLFYSFRDITGFLLVFTAVLILFKVMATAITIGAGGNGGIFATTLMMGALFGFFYSKSLNLINPDLHLNETNFVAVGMAGILSGVIHSPLTAIFLIAEITGGYVLFVPLMIVSALAYFIAGYLEPYTIYTKKLAERGYFINRDKDKTVLSLMDLNKLLETDFIKLSPNSCLRDVVALVPKTRRNIFPVVDDQGKLEGILRLDHIREIMFQADQYDCVFVKDLMESNFVAVNIGEDMLSVMKKFEENKVFNLPVVEAGNYKGFVSKSNIFSIYRTLIIEESQPLSTI